MIETCIRLSSNLQLKKYILQMVFFIAGGNFFILFQTSVCVTESFQLEGRSVSLNLMYLLEAHF